MKDNKRYRAIITAFYSIRHNKINLATTNEVINKELVDKPCKFYQLKLFKHKKETINLFKMKKKKLNEYNFGVYNLLNFIEFRENIYYIFGLLCLISWFIFNLWILRDYFFPWWFKPIYTDKGFNKIALERKKMEYLRRQHIDASIHRTCGGHSCISRFSVPGGHSCISSGKKISQDIQ
uniref:Uncharacterized protein n=1 Tax=Wuchereria bancrofti TaxID=6293 RepID=A0AAF5PUI0_WUCBA